jgi:hypothetical protein
MPSRSCAVLCFSVACLAAAPPASGADVIDRVLAVVNGSVITLSDVQGALRFGLVSPEPANDLRGAVDRMIERRLALVEVERYAPPEPPVSGIDAALAAARATFPSDAAFAAALAEVGMSVDQLRRHYRDDLRRQIYEEQRFGFALHPSEDDTLAYYRAHQERFRRGGAVPAYDDIRTDVRAALIADKRSELVREWMAGLRRRADVSILPL